MSRATAALATSTATRLPARRACASSAKLSGRVLMAANMRHCSPAQRSCAIRCTSITIAASNSNGAREHSDWWNTPKVVNTLPPSVEPKIRIDNVSDPMATILIIEFGDFLGELLDTIQALHSLGLNVNRAYLSSEKTVNTFYVTDEATSEKILRAERLQEIETCVLFNIFQYHPEAEPIGKVMYDGSRNRLVMPSAGPEYGLVDNIADENPFAPRPEPKIPTSIKICSEAAGTRSRLDVVTQYRAGLLEDIVRTLKDISVNVISAELDTIGLMSHDNFFVTYQGTALNSSMEELVKNALYYYLALAEVETDESY